MYLAIRHFRHFVEGLGREFHVVSNIIDFHAMACAQQNDEELTQLQSGTTSLFAGSPPCLAQMPISFATRLQEVPPPTIRP